MQIRQMKKEDIPACAGILCSVYNNELWMCRWKQETAEAYLKEIYENPRFVGYVAEDSGSVTAAILGREKIWWNNSEIYIEEMFVNPQMQGQGIGSQLLGRMEQYATDHGLAGMTLSTNRYAPAPRFYKKNGFTQCGHVLFMAKEIEKPT